MKSKTLGLIAFLALVLLATACSPSPAEKLNEEGNDAYAQQAYQEALVAYQTAQIKEPDLAEPYYNAANALYRQGEYTAALEQLQMALTFAEEEPLVNSSFFNLGNAAYNNQDLGTAVAAYTESLLLNPDDQDAKYNLELALQQQEQEQEEQQEQQQEQEQEEQQQEQEQEEQQDQSQNGEDQEQEQEESAGGEGQEEQEQQQEQEPAQDSEGQENEQEQEQEQPEDGQAEKQQEDQPNQQGQPQSGQPGEEQEQQQQQPSQVPAPGQRMTEEQAEQLLAAIARDSETLQERLGQIFAVPWSPPAQDW